MNLDNIIPYRDNWKIINGIVFKKKLIWMPIMNLRRRYIEIYFDNRLHKDVLYLISKMGDNEFYLISPLFSNPKFSSLDNHKINIENYLSNYAKSSFFYGFKKINFNIVENLVKYCKKFDCMTLIKESFDYVNNEVQYEDYDWHSNKKFYPFDEEVRTEFNSLYRQIKVQSIFT